MSVSWKALSWAQLVGVLESVHKRELCGGGQGGAAYTIKTIALEASHLFSSPPIALSPEVSEVVFCVAHTCTLLGD